jgi:thiol:disulfide interchange protein DsbC
MFNSKGKNLTYLQTVALQKKQVGGLLKTINLKKAIKVGDGPVKVIEFINPDCPFCRLSMKLFEKPEIAKKVTRYIFLLPQPSIHPHSTVMTEFVLNHKNKAKWLAKVMIGSLAKIRYNKVKASKESLDLTNYYTSIAHRYGIYGVPYFIIGGKVVLGLNYAAIYKDLGLKYGINLNKIPSNIAR